MTVDTQAAVEQVHLYQYKVSLETTKDRVNMSITVYSNDQNIARDEAIALLENTRESLEGKGYSVSPIVQQQKGEGK
jgi:hypothetical protein